MDGGSPGDSIASSRALRSEQQGQSRSNPNTPSQYVQSPRENKDLSGTGVNPANLNWANMQELEQLEEFIRQGTATRMTNSGGAPEPASSVAMDVLNEYTRYLDGNSAGSEHGGFLESFNRQQNGQGGQTSASVPVSGPGTASSSGSFPFDSYGSSTDMDMLQGGYGKTANPPVDIDASNDAHVNGDSSSVSLVQTPAMSKTASRSTVITAEEYTPLISPSMTPMEKNSVSARARAKKVGFSPLTSPALEFQRYHSHPSSLRQKRKDQQADMSPPSLMVNDHGSRRGSTAYKRSKTPNATPVMAPSNSSSPVIGPNGTRNPYNNYQLQRSHSQQPRSHHRMHHRNASIQTPSQDPAFDAPDELMLPPAPRNSSVSSAHHLSGSFSAAPAATPATLMSFSSSSHMMPNDNVMPNPHHDARSAQSSPVILPSSSSAIFLQQQQRKRTTTTTTNSSHASPNGMASSSPQIPQMQFQTEQAVPKVHSVKKINHKLAEQGRRNRMNVAIQELDGIIPESLKGDTVVPSKATTVELSSKYILQLQAENSQLRSELKLLKLQLEKCTKQVSSTDSTASISPLECIDADKR